MSPVQDLALRVSTAAAPHIPIPLRRAMAGRQVIIDGNILDPSTQLLLRGMALTGEGEMTSSDDVALDRATMRKQAGLLQFSTPVGQVRNFSIPGPAGPIGVRHYKPVVDRTGVLLVFFHGGGWVIGDLETHDQPCRQTCRDAGVSVLSVDYRLAPEHKAPVPAQDCLAAYLWAVEHAAELGVAPDRIAVGGDSAGGNLAAVVAQQARDTGAQPPLLQFLIYPAVDFTVRRPSRDLFAEGFFLTKAAMDGFESHYLDGSEIDKADPQVSPILADNLAGLPPALITTAGFDPLRDEGNEYAEKLRAAGVPVDLRVQGPLIHGFYNMARLGGAPSAAVDELTSALRAHLSR
ncbi:alpha/beta hydrolase [Mycobacterium sp. CBMA271]|uniref:alpha/beta hydrolase n=1 Tax=unclassified Mycobacteroides TaxID=2618759 RepID=UPI001329171A|nr:MULTISPECIES: alpha/beta hydrolase [unclassified Mycobacteroides]MUM16778.1 lipase [Mycobacteroides sp. CBMA 326]MUM20251.1 alpha/beta hydrolase [Mycobacteroides sp. CBMA 271]